MAISQIENGEVGDSVRNKINSLISSVNSAVQINDPISSLSETSTSKILTDTEREKLAKSLTTDDINLLVPEFVKNTYDSDSPPSPSDDINKGYSVGSLWMYDGYTYRCLNNSASSAHWINTSLTNTDIGLTVAAYVKHSYINLRAPTINDDEDEGFTIGSNWGYSNKSYRCIDASRGAARWISMSLSAADLGSAAFASRESFATSEQGLKADSAIQLSNINTSEKINSLISSGGSTFITTNTPISYNSLTSKPVFGSAAFLNSSAFATSGQGMKADTAMQVNSVYSAQDASTIRAQLGLGSAAVTSTSSYASADQGIKADLALQAPLNYTEGSLDSSMITTFQSQSGNIIKVPVSSIKTFITELNFNVGSIPFVDGNSKLTQDSNLNWSPISNILKVGSVRILPFLSSDINSSVTSDVSYGSLSGTLLEGPLSGHVVVGLNKVSGSNLNYGFSVATKTNDKFDKLLLTIDVTGKVGIGMQPRSWATLDISGTVGATNLVTPQATITTLNSTSLTSGTVTVTTEVASGSVKNTGAITTASLTASGNVSAVNFNASGTVTAQSLVESSSLVLKTNISPIINALDLISNINGVTYDRLDGSSYNEAGFIAEHLQPLLPNVVYYNDDGQPSGIKYTKIIAYLVEAVKELKALIER